MNLESIAQNEKYKDVLQNGHSNLADFYDFDSDEGTQGRAIVLILSKAATKNADEALIYLLQKQTKMLGIWERELEKSNPSLSEFIQFFISEKGFENIIGKVADRDGFWESYQSTITGIANAENFECSKNGIHCEYNTLLHKEGIKQVICFDDSWQEQNFFIETELDWVLYHWSSGI